MARLKILFLIAVVLAGVLLVTHLPEPEPQPEPRLPREVTEPSERLESEEVQLALAKDPVAFVVRQLDQEDPIERSVGLLAIQDVVRQQGPEIFGDLLPLVMERRTDADPWVRVLTVTALLTIRSLDPEAVDATFVRMLQDPHPGICLSVCGAVAAVAALQRLAGAAAKNPRIERALLDAAERQPEGDVRSTLLATAGEVGGPIAAEAILARLKQQGDDPFRVAGLLSGLGYCGGGESAASALLWREAFNPDRHAVVRAGARRGLAVLATDKDLENIDSAQLANLRRETEVERSSALLLARVARARDDAELARAAVVALTDDLLPFARDVLETANVLFTLDDLTELPRQEILSAIDRALENPAFPPWESHVALLELRDSLL